ncbi:hypothetical protein HDE_00006 [Halotydeus destructor]|nr:hypothetical protein HDE_00006 [Halotydeus destructor]
MANSDHILSKLVRGIEKSRFVLIEHSTDVDHLAFLACFAKQRKLSTRTVVLFESQLFTPLTNDGEVIDFTKLSLQSYLQRLSEFTNRCSKSLNSCLMIDSINCLVLCHSPNENARMFTELLEKFEIVVAAVSTEVISDVQRFTLERLATTIIKVNYCSTDKCLKSIVTHKKRSRKIGYKVSSSEENFVLVDFEVKSVETSKHSQAQGTSNNEPDLKGLTFNLTLNDDDAKVRDKVPLPYIKQAESKVIYYPDKNDDIDEDDPDDDLDI